MAPPNVYPLYDRILGGQLAKMLREHRDAGLSAPAIRDRMRDEHGVDVSTKTVRGWLRDLDQTEQAS